MRRLPKQATFDWPQVRTRSGPHGFGGWRTVSTTFLLGAIIIAGPLALGGVRWWGELPLLSLVAALLLVQAIRLIQPAPDTLPHRADIVDGTAVFFAFYALMRWLVAPTLYAGIETLDVVACTGVFLTCRYGMINRRCCLALLFTLVGLGLFETAFGYYLSDFSDPTDAASQWFPYGLAERAHLAYFPRWVGTYGSPNHYAATLIMAISAALALGSFSKLSWPLRIVLIYVALTMMVGLMCSGSRGAWVALPAAVISLVAMGIRNGTTHWWVPVTSAIMFLLFAAFIFSLSPLVRYRMSEGAAIVDQRTAQGANELHVAQDAFAIAREHPFLGDGPGTFAFLHPPGDNLAASWGGALARDDYLNCVGDYGLFGFGIAMFFVAVVTLKFFQPLWVDNRWQDRTLVAAGFAIWIALLIHSWVDYNLHIPANALLFFAFTGLALGRIQQERGVDLGLRRRMPWRRRFGWALVVITALFAAGIIETTIIISSGNNPAAHFTRLP